ncbi:MAG TPA: DnaB-like helicase N-terminal domain-containing protein, partial [Acidimicrobiia bacterium]|nr:DnaB-like helicase N-terminal domain-containing protein [Acidimicrobiia bacterium]
MTAQLERRSGGGSRSSAAPPHSIEAEESVLGAVMLSAEAANVALETLSPDDFYVPTHQMVWQAVT